MRRYLPLIPIFVFFFLVTFLGVQLANIERGKLPEIVPSALLGKPAPNFDFPALLDERRGLKTDDFKGKVTLVNFFASWCVPCHAEHPLLMKFSGKGVVLAGVAFKDKPKDVKEWFSMEGDPYNAVIADPDGRLAIDFGTYGMPETYLIDKQGIIRFKQPGPLTPEIIDRQILPLIEKLGQ